MQNTLSLEEKREVREWARGKRGHHRWTCPHCSPTRQNKNAECLSLTIEHDRIIYKCHHCEVQGAFRIEEQSFKPTALKQQSALNEHVAAWLKNRGISREIGILYGCIWVSAFFPELRRETEGIGFAYTDNGVNQGYKLRSLVEKAHACTKALKTFYGIDQIDLTDSRTIIICEGELDVLSIAEARIPNAISVPNGASSLGNNEKSGFMWEARETLNAANKIIIATDNDEPGARLGDEIARRLGRHRCWTVEWPQGCKDANDVLMKYSADKLSKVILAAKPWPIAGLYEADKFFVDVKDLYANGFEGKVKTGLEAVDQIYSVGPGLLTVVTGIPGNGKSTFVDQLMLNLARMYGHVFTICSFENPPSVHIAKLAEMLLQKDFFTREYGGQRMTENELTSTFPFLHKHFKFMHQDDGAKADVDSLIERIKTAVFRWGINGAVIDPYNYIQRDKNAESETQFIDDVLTKLRLVASAHDLHLWFIAHPTKMTADHDGKYQVPKGYSISGSAAWYAKADFGLTIHKAEFGGEVEVHNWKTRFNWLGREGKVTILYDTSRNCYIADMIKELTPYDANN